MTRLENALRVRFPALPLEARFLAVYQEPMFLAADDGDRLVEAQAAFHLVVRNPRHPEFDKYFSARTPWKSWRMDDQGYKHHTEPLLDPAYPIFYQLASQASVWWTNTTELTPLSPIWKATV